MKVLILTNRYSKFVGDALASIDYDEKEHEIFIHWVGKANFDDLPDYDIGISFMYQYKVPAKEVNTHTWFNFHPAPLPKYKGRNLCWWAIMNGEKEFGATLHYMDENFDTGDIVEVTKFPILDFYTAEDLSNIAIAVSKDLFKKYLPCILAGEEFPRIPNIGGIYFKKLPISDFIDIRDGCRSQIREQIRAITYGNFYPKIDIGGVIYKIVRE